MNPLRRFSGVVVFGLASSFVVGLPAAISAPIVRFVDVAAAPLRGGPNGGATPITIYGTGFGASRGTAQVTIGGRPVARYLQWGRRADNPALQTIVVQPATGTPAGRVVVTRARQRSRQRVGFTPTNGRVRWVAASGADNAVCTRLRRCRTIQHVVDSVARPRDVILVAGPTIVDDEVWIRTGAGGRAGGPISIVGLPGTRPTFTATSRPVIVEGDHVTVAGLRFPTGKALVVGNDRSRGLRAIGNVFTGQIGFDAIGTHGSDILVAGNVCRVSGSSVGTQGHCFYISNGSRIRISDNIAHGATGYGVHIFDQQRSSDDIKRVISSVIVERNQISGSAERSGVIVSMGDEGARGNTIRNVVIRRNTIRANNHTGIVVGERATQVVITGNRLIRNGRQGIHVSDLATINGVRITGNVIDQSANTSCTVFCSWFQRAHIQIGARARSVSLAKNRYTPRPPIVLR